MPKQLIGPFTEMVTMDRLPHCGAIEDRQLEIVRDGGLLIEGETIVKVLQAMEFKEMRKKADRADAPFQVFEVERDAVLLPGFIDSHTHMCFAGSRAKDYARRLAGESYLDLVHTGGGILSTVELTRQASEDELVSSLSLRARKHLLGGVTTAEVKSGYGLNLEDEVKMLRAIRRVNGLEGPHPQLIPTCLAAHINPPEFASAAEYLDFVMGKVLPRVWEEHLAQRVDIYVEEGAFPPELAKTFLHDAKRLGFAATVHADQFSVGGSQVAAEVKAVSADHLEQSTDKELGLLMEGHVIATVLPGSSLGLGLPFAHAREMLDKGLCLVIASDWNPGSAPLGDLLTLAALLGANQKLSIAETLAGITVRAARVLGLEDRGVVREGMRADLVCFSCSSHDEVLYHQGALRPSLIIHGGRRLERSMES